MRQHHRSQAILHGELDPGPGRDCPGDDCSSLQMMDGGNAVGVCMAPFLFDPI